MPWKSGPRAAEVKASYEAHDPQATQTLREAAESLAQVQAQLAALGGGPMSLSEWGLEPIVEPPQESGERARPAVEPPRVAHARAGLEAAQQAAAAAHAQLEQARDTLADAEGTVTVARAFAHRATADSVPMVSRLR